jgi:hypothetical protein
MVRPCRWTSALRALRVHHPSGYGGYQRSRMVIRRRPPRDSQSGSPQVRHRFVQVCGRPWFAATSEHYDDPEFSASQRAALTQRPCSPRCSAGCSSHSVARTPRFPLPAAPPSSVSSCPPIPSMLSLSSPAPTTTCGSRSGTRTLHYPASSRPASCPCWIPGSTPRSGASPHPGLSHKRCFRILRLQNLAARASLPAANDTSLLWTSSSVTSWLGQARACPLFLVPGAAGVPGSRAARAGNLWGNGVPAPIQHRARPHTLL